MRRRVVGAIEPVADLGRLLSAAEIAAELYAGRASAKWVAARMPRDRMVKVGKRHCWFEADARQAMADSRGMAA